VAIAGVPVFALPYLWLRPPDRIGVLPPIVALRGPDGVLLGSGVHLPWRGEGGAGAALDLLAGAYLQGGAQLGARLRTGESATAITADLIHGTRVAVDARGSLVSAETGGAAAAWTIDAIRGDRARSGTVDLAIAARPFDDAAAEASLRGAAGPVSGLIAGGAIARAPRGEGPIAGGPRATLALGGALGTIGSWSADASGVVLGDAARGGAALPIGRAAAGAEIDARPGPFELRAAVRARARYAGDDAEGDPASEAAAAARVDLELPFARSFAGGGAGEAPLVHGITPGITVRGAIARVSGSFFSPIGGAIPPASWLAATGFSTALGRYAGPALRFEARAGATGDDASARALFFARLGADAEIAGGAIEGAAVGDRLGGARAIDAASARALAIVGRARIGPAAGGSLRVDVAAQAGASAGEARAIASGAWAALPGDALAYLASPGVTGGAEISLPWARAFRTAARADVDLVAGALLAVRALAEYRHPCGCLGATLMGAHRIGRDGVDVALSIDVVPPLRAGK
jgi:hypothetical protein